MSQIKRRITGAAGPPTGLLSGQLAWNNVDSTLYIGAGDDGTEKATSIVRVGGTGAFLLASMLGMANGVAGLDSGGKLPLSIFPAAMLGSLNYQGVWDATANVPTLTSGMGTKGRYYKVSVAGATSLDGQANWNVGDLVIYDGAAWGKVDGPAEAVTTVAGRIGAVTLTTADLTDATTIGRSVMAAASMAAARAALKVDTMTAVSDRDYTVLATDYNVKYTSISTARTVTLPPAGNLNPGTRVRVGDFSGNASGVNTITVVASAGQKISSSGSYLINAGYGQVEIESDGVSSWAVINSTVQAGASLDDGTY